jgi:hypothetical protein
MRWSQWTLGTLCLASASFAGVSERTAKVFRREDRALEPPPKSLRADSHNPEDRYTVGEHRASRVLRASNDDPSVENETYLEATAEEVPPVAPPEQDRASSRSTRRAAKKSSTRNRSLASDVKSIVTGRESFDGERLFGIGFVGGGPYGVFGSEFDFAANEQWSAGFGIGTGMSYSTWGLYGRYFMKEGRWSPFIQTGYAQWTLSRAPRGGEGVIPNHLAQRFFADKDGFVRNPKTIHLVYPGVGVLYQHRSGIAAQFSVQYFIRANDFSGGLWGSTGLYFYF